MGIEEAEQGKTNYQDKTMHRIVKLLTSSGEQTVRGMYKESIAANMNLIINMNTNVPDLYGLVRGDSALIQRLVILNYKPIGDKRDWLHERAEYFMKNPNFAYSLYHYLSVVHEIPQSFSSCRYFGQDKFDFIAKAQMDNKNVVEEWLKEYNIQFSERKIRGKYVSCMYMTQGQANDSYREYYKQQNNQFAPKKINETMINLGFELKNTKVQNKSTTIWIMDKDKFDGLVKRLDGTNDLEAIEFEDESDESI
jgi:hypothetical protein